MRLKFTPIQLLFHTVFRAEFQPELLEDFQVGRRNRRQRHRRHNNSVKEGISALLIMSRVFPKRRPRSATLLPAANRASRPRPQAARWASFSSTASSSRSPCGARSEEHTSEL